MMLSLYFYLGARLRLCLSRPMIKGSAFKAGLSLVVIVKIWKGKENTEGYNPVIIFLNFDYKPFPCGFTTMESFYNDFPSSDRTWKRQKVKKFKKLLKIFWWKFLFLIGRMNNIKIQISISYTFILFAPSISSFWSRNR